MHPELIKKMCDQWLEESQDIIDTLNGFVTESGEHMEGNSFYIDGWEGQLAKTFATKRYNLFHQGMMCSHILEIGFNAGHSCLLYLLADPESKIQLFDLGDHAYSHKCYDYLDLKFPGRLSITWGDSVKTLTAFQPDVQYDMIHIDGGHDEAVITSDIDNAWRLADKDTTIIVDDISFHPKHMVKELTTVVVEKLVARQFLPAALPFYSPYHTAVHANKAFSGLYGFCEHTLPLPTFDFCFQCDY